MLNRELMVQKMVASEKGLTKAAANRLLTLVGKEIKEAVSAGETASFTGFGSFVAVDTAARIGRNVQTGEPIQIPAGKRIRFRPGKAFKGSL